MLWLAVTVILHLGAQPTSLPSLVNGPDSDETQRYVCYDSSGRIESVVTERGHDALLCICVPGDACLHTEEGDIGDHVENGQVVTP